MSFARVSGDYWHLHGPAAMLRAKSFRQIVQQLHRRGVVIRHKRQSSKSSPGAFRAIVTLRCPASLVAAFHSSDVGYRAQFYSSPGCGERANAHVIRKVVPGILEQLKGREKRTCPQHFLKQSLLSDAAKIWIHQGQWLRRASQHDQNLRVKRWELAAAASEGKRKKKAHWARLTPLAETLLEVKGAFIDRNGLALDLKPTRAEDLHDLGFT